MCSGNSLAEVGGGVVVGKSEGVLVIEVDLSYVPLLIVPDVLKGWSFCSCFSSLQVS